MDGARLLSVTTAVCLDEAMPEKVVVGLREAIPGVTDPLALTAPRGHEEHEGRGLRVTEQFLPEADGEAEPAHEKKSSTSEVEAALFQ